MGFAEAHDTFAPGFYRLLRMIFATWALWSSYVLSMVSYLSKFEVLLDRGWEVHVSKARSRRLRRAIPE